MTAAIDLCVDWARVGECVGGEFHAVTRDLTAGEWNLTGAVANVTLEAGVTLDDINTIRVADNKRIPFAGYVAPIDEGTGGLTVNDTPTGQRFTLAGPDLWHIPAGRLAYPTPSTEPPWANSFDERTGQASSVAAAYVLNNLGIVALAARQYPGVSIVDRFVGATGAWSARLQPLDELIARICREGGITCRLTVDFTGAVQLDFASRRDRTTTCVLSDQGDLINTDHRTLDATATLVVAGGQGVLNARTFRTATDGSAGAARREVFSDQAALSTATELQQSATATLAGAGATFAIHSELAATAAQTVTPGVDYDIGDIVAVEIDNVRHPVPVVAITYLISANRQIISPVLGDAGPDLLNGLTRDVANLAARFDVNIA